MKKVSLKIKKKGKSGGRGTVLYFPVLCVEKNPEELS